MRIYEVLTIFLLFAYLHILPISGQSGLVRDGVYAVRSTISSRTGAARGKRAVPSSPTVSLYLEALAPRNPRELGQVVASNYRALPGSQWQIRRNETLSWMASQGNRNNVVTGTGYRFVSAQNGTFIIERTVPRGRPQCLRNNGQGQYVSFVNCDSNIVYPLSPFRWEFCPVTSTTGGRPQQQSG